MNLIRSIRIYPQILHRNLDPTGLPVMRIEIDHDNDYIIEIFIMFAVTDDLIIVDRVKFQAPVVMEGRIFLADTVDPGNKFLEIARTIQLPKPNLIFF